MTKEAHVAKPVDASDLKSDVEMTCGFDPHRGHQSTVSFYDYCAAKMKFEKFNGSNHVFNHFLMWAITSDDYQMYYDRYVCPTITKHRIDMINGPHGETIIKAWLLKYYKGTDVLE